MAALGHPVADAGKALLGAVQPHIIQADLIPGLFGGPDGPLGALARQGGLLGEADPFFQAGFDFADGRFSSSQFIPTQGGGQLIHVDDGAQVGQLATQNAGQAGFAHPVDPADDGIGFHG